MLGAPADRGTIRGWTTAWRGGRRSSSRPERFARRLFGRRGGRRGATRIRVGMSAKAEKSRGTGLAHRADRRPGAPLPTRRRTAPTSRRRRRRRLGDRALPLLLLSSSPLDEERRRPSCWREGRAGSINRTRESTTARYRDVEREEKELRRVAIFFSFSFCHRETIEELSLSFSLARFNVNFFVQERFNARIKFIGYCTSWRSGFFSFSLSHGFNFEREICLSSI